MRPAHRRRLARGSAALLFGAASLGAAPASATTALFFPRGSTARADRHHLTVSVTASTTITWDAVDIAGTATEIGAIVAVKAGGRVEVTARTWVDVVEEASKVRVATIPSASCKAIAVAVTGGGSLAVDASAGGSLKAESDGCNGGTTAPDDAGATGGCTSNSSAPSSGCGGCESCEPGKPDEHGHPGCSALMTSTTGCGPSDPNSGSSSSGGVGGDAGASTRIGPYEVVKVGAADGSAARWITAHDYEPGASFDTAMTELEKAGYDVFAIRARPPASASILQSLRVVTTSPSPSLPLRLLRMGSAPGSTTPVTLVLLAGAPQTLVDASVGRIEESALAWSGSISNYEALASAALGVAPSIDDGGADDSGADPDAGPAADAAVGSGASGTRWLFEAARSLANRPTPKSGEDAAPASAAPTLADDFRKACGERAAVKHLVCSSDDDLAGDASAPSGDGGLDDGGLDDGGLDDGLEDGGTLDAGTSAGDASTGAGGCPEVSRTACDDLDLAIAANGAAVATRFRGVVTGDPAGIADLVFAPSAAPLPEGSYTVRAEGQPGLCEPIEGSAGLGASGSASEEASATCRQTAPARSLARVNLGPILVLLVTVRALAGLLRRKRS